MTPLTQGPRSHCSSEKKQTWTNLMQARYLKITITRIFPTKRDLTLNKH